LGSKLTRKTLYTYFLILIMGFLSSGNDSALLRVNLRSNPARDCCL